MSTHRKYISPLPGIHWNGDETDCTCGSCMQLRVRYCSDQNKYNGIQGFNCVTSYQMYPGQSKRFAREYAERDAQYIASLVRRVDKAEKAARNNAENVDPTSDPKTKADQIQQKGDEAKKATIAKIWAELAGDGAVNHLEAFNKEIPQIGQGTSIDQPIFENAISEAVSKMGYWDRSVLEWFLTKWTRLHPSAGIAAVRLFKEDDHPTTKKGKIELFVYCVKNCYNKKLLFEECIRHDNVDLFGSIRIVGANDDGVDREFYQDLAQLASILNATKCLDYLKKVYQITVLDALSQKKRAEETARAEKERQLNIKKAAILEEGRKKLELMRRQLQEETERQLLALQHAEASAHASTQEAANEDAALAREQDLPPMS